MPRMRSIKITILASLVATAGVTAATALTLYFDTLAKDYPLDTQWATPPWFVSVYDVPTLQRTDLIPELGAGALGSDMAGKISGIQYMSLYFEGPDNRTNYYATFGVDVTGSISTKGTDPVVKMKLKGTGYSVDLAGNHGPGASLNLTFTSTRPLTYSYEVLVLGSETRTNDYADLAGTFSGTVKVGNGFTYKLNNEPAWLSDAVATGDFGYDYGYIWVIEGANFVEVWHGSGLQFEGIPLQGQVIQPRMKNEKLSIVAGIYSGKGSVNDKNQTYKATLKSVAGMAGAKLNLSGYTGPLVVDYTSTDGAGKFVPDIVAGAIKTLDLSGKAWGQKVSQKGVNPDAPSP